MTILCLLSELRIDCTKSIEEHHGREAFLSLRHLLVEVAQLSGQVASRAETGQPETTEVLKTASRRCFSLVGLESILHFRDAAKDLQSRVQVTGVSQVLKSGRCGPFLSCVFGFSHVFKELDFLNRRRDSCASFSGCGAQHGENLTWLCIELGQIGVIFQLATLDEERLTFGLDTSKREELELESFAGGGGIKVDIVFLSLVFDDDLERLAPLSSL